MSEKDSIRGEKLVVPMGDESPHVTGVDESRAAGVSFIESFRPSERHSNANVLIAQGKVFFGMMEYQCALDSFRRAADQGSYQGNFLQGLAMTQMGNSMYFEGLSHMIEATTSMLVQQNLDIIREVLEKGASEGHIPQFNGKVTGNLREISITLHIIARMANDEPRKPPLLGKLLKLLQSYGIN